MIRKILEECREKNLLHTVAVLMIILSAIFMLIWAFVIFAGRKIETGSNPEVEQADAVDCKSELVRYPYLNRLNGEIGHELNVRAVFVAEKVNTVWLNYSLDYDEEEMALTAYNELQANFNIQLANSGISQSGGMETKFTLNKNNMSLGIYVRNGKIGEMAPYIMLKSGELEDKNSIIDNYENLGLECTSTLDE